MTPVEVLEEVETLLVRLQDEVPQIHGCLLASADGLLLVDGGGSMPGPQTAALTSALCALAEQAVALARRGTLVDAVVRGTQGHLMVFAISGTAVLAVSCGDDVAPAWVHLRARPVVEKLAAVAGDLRGFAAQRPGAE